MQKNPFGLITPFPHAQVRRTTWAGEFVSTGNLCCATDDGSIFEYNVHGHLLRGVKPPVNLESINGVAFTPKAMAVCTPSEILILIGEPLGRRPDAVHLEQGAYGIIPGKNNSFLAPLGKNGVRHIQYISDDKFIISTFYSSDTDVFFYKAAFVASAEDGSEVFACAGRKNGLVTLSVDSLGQPQSISLSKGVSPISGAELDVIDVCPTPSFMYPFAAVCLGMEGSLNFTFDLRNESPSVGLQLLNLRGTPYTLLAAQGHVFVLTSEEFWVFPDLASKFLTRESFGRKVAGYRTPIHAVDCWLAYGKFIQIIVEDGVLILEIDSLLKGLSRESPRSDLDIEPDSFNRFSHFELVGNLQSDLVLQ